MSRCHPRADAATPLARLLWAAGKSPRVWLALPRAVTYVCTREPRESTPRDRRLSAGGDFGTDRRALTEGTIDGKVAAKCSDAVD
jgi:hypothetical protein